jgi:hypothetical protein
MSGHGRQADARTLQPTQPVAFGNGHQPVQKPWAWRDTRSPRRCLPSRPYEYATATAALVRRAARCVRYRPGGAFRIARRWWRRSRSPCATFDRRLNPIGARRNACFNARTALADSSIDVTQRRTSEAGAVHLPYARADGIPESVLVLDVGAKGVARKAVRSPPRPGRRHQTRRTLAVSDRSAP